MNKDTWKTFFEWASKLTIALGVFIGMRLITALDNNSLILQKMGTDVEVIKIEIKQINKDVESVQTNMKEKHNDIERRVEKLEDKHRK